MAAVGCLACAVAIGFDPAHAAEKAPNCTLRRAAALDADVSHGRLVIHVQIDAHDARMIVDTGSPFNMISRQLADQLNLPLRTARENAAIDMAGKSARHYVLVHQVTLGGMSTTSETPFIVMGEDQAHQTEIDGIFSANFLAAYDVELDIAHGKLNLFTKDHCPGNVVYWTQDYVSIPFTLDGSLHVTFKAQLDGHEMRALLDTGATPSILSAQAARRLFDFDPGEDTTPDGHVVAGGGAELPFYRKHFELLDIGGVAFRNTQLRIVADKASRIMREHASLEHDLTIETLETPLIIGLQHLVKLRAYIAYDERMLYISAADAH
jgi:predicted aspartyl protease